MVDLIIVVEFVKPNESRVCAVSLVVSENIFFGNHKIMTHLVLSFHEVINIY